MARAQEGIYESEAFGAIVKAGHDCRAVKSALAAISVANIQSGVVHI